MEKKKKKLLLLVVLLIAAGGIYFGWQQSRTEKDAIFLCGILRLLPVSGSGHIPV